MNSPTPNHPDTSAFRVGLTGDFYKDNPLSFLPLSNLLNSVLRDTRKKQTPSNKQLKITSMNRILDHGKKYSQFKNLPPLAGVGEFPDAITKGLSIGNCVTRLKRYNSICIGERLGGYYRQLLAYSWSHL